MSRQQKLAKRWRECVSNCTPVKKAGFQLSKASHEIASIVNRKPEILPKKLHPNKNSFCATISKTRAS